MSVVCAKIFDDYISIASDSGVYAGDSRVPSTTIEKILHIADDFLIGVCGDVSEMNLMKWFARDHRPEENTEQGIFHFMRDFFDWCVDEKHGFQADEPELPDGVILPKSVNEYLIVYQNKLYCCMGPQVHGITQYAAIGAGAPYALTALSLGHDCVEAVRIASELCVYVHTPVHWYNAFDPVVHSTAKQLTFSGQI